MCVQQALGVLEHGLDVLGHVLPLDNEALVVVDAPLCPKLGDEELDDALQTALHHGTDLLEVDLQRLLGPHVCELWGRHRTLLLLYEVGMHVEDACNSVKHVLVSAVGHAVTRVTLLAADGLELGDDLPLLREEGIVRTKPLQRP